jgi:DNA-binding CsgD family transcriptional regulator
MSEIRQIGHDSAAARLSVAYESILRALGSPHFGTRVHEAALSLTSGVRRLYLFEAKTPDDTSLHYFCGEPGLESLFPVYRKWYLRQDPVSDAYRAAPSCTDMALQRVRPMHITSPSFRRRVFDEGGIIERISVIQRGPDAWRVMSIARHASDGCCSDAEIKALVELAGIVLPMLPQSHQHGSGPAPLPVPELEQRFAGRFPDLSQRELQVCARAAAGMDVGATAADLGIARTSVLTYRQRAYHRLHVTSALALRALVTH